MARTAKRYQEATQKKKSSILVYTAAIYARLSVDNDKKKSESIDTQIALIKEFVQKNNENPDRKYEIVIYGTYSDIGKTGTNFARDGFEQMMQDVRDGKKIGNEDMSIIAVLIAGERRIQVVSLERLITKYWSRFYWKK